MMAAEAVRPIATENRGVRPEHRWYRKSPRRRGAPRPNGRTAFTIVELLVVAAIMATLFGLVLVSARPSVGGELRRAAQQFASVVLAAQSSGIGRPEGSALVMESGGAISIAVSKGNKPPFVIGTVGQGMPPTNPAAVTAPVTITPTSGGDLQQGYRIQFFGDSPTSPASAWFAFQPVGTVRLRMEDGQSIANTVWPASPEGPLRTRVACYPSKGSLAMEFPRSAGIDLRYSGTGDDPATLWGGLAAKGDIAISFDTVGVIDALMQGLGSAAAAARQPVEPIYFLIATRTDIEADQSLANDRSLWVAIQPQTGRVTVSSNVSQPGKDRVALRAARAAARATLAAGK